MPQPALVHAPLRQTWPALHALPHLPQFSASDWVSVQPFVHAASPDRHWQAELAQVCPVTHALPQLPQFALLLETSTQAEPHTACPAAQAEPWPPDPPALLVVPPPLVPEEQAVGRADPRHKSNSNANDLFMLAGRTPFRTQVVTAQAEQAKKGRPRPARSKLDDHVLDLACPAIGRGRGVDGQRELEPAMSHPRGTARRAVRTGVCVSS